MQRSSLSLPIISGIRASSGSNEDSEPRLGVVSSFQHKGSSIKLKFVIGGAYEHASVTGYQFIAPLSLRKTLTRYLIQQAVLLYFNIWNLQKAISIDDILMKSSSLVPFSLTNLEESFLSWCALRTSFNLCTTPSRVLNTQLGRLTSRWNNKRFNYS